MPARPERPKEEKWVNANNIYSYEKKNDKARKARERLANCPENTNCAPYIPVREREEEEEREEGREEKEIASLLGRAPFLLKNNRK